MRSFKILFITFVSLIVASIAFDPSRITQESKEGIEDSNAGVPAIPKEQDQLVMMDIEVWDENADAKDEPLQRISKISNWYEYMMTKILFSDSQSVQQVYAHKSVGFWNINVDIVRVRVAAYVWSETFFFYKFIRK